MLAPITFVFAILAAGAAAQQAIYGQCGGQGYNGQTSCVSGTQCYYQNDYYSQCLSDENLPEWAEEGSGEEGEWDEGDDEGGEDWEE